MVSFTLLLFTLIPLSVLSEEWINPHSMDSDVKIRLKQSAPGTDASLNNSEAYEQLCKSDQYLRRIVRLILNHITFVEEISADQLLGHLHLRVSQNDHKFLTEFAKKETVTENDFSEVNSIFEVAMQKTSYEDYKGKFMSLQEEIYLMFFNETTSALAIGIACLYIVYRLLKAKFSLKMVILFFLIIGYVVDFIITYLRLVQKQEIDSMVTIKSFGNMPPECDPQKASWWTFITTVVGASSSQNQCREYYQATFINPKYLVTPIRVSTAQFRDLIVEPLDDLGEALGKFGKSLFVNLPWGANLVIFPVMLVTVCILVIISFVFITKTPVRLGGVFLNLEFGHRDRREAIRNRRREPVRRVVYVREHRELVQDVVNVRSSNNEPVEGKDKGNSTKIKSTVASPKHKAGNRSSHATADTEETRTNDTGHEESQAQEENTKKDV